MIHKLINLTFIVAFSVKSIFSQELKDFTGVYAVEQICAEFPYIELKDTSAYELEVNIASNDTNDLELKIFDSFFSYTLNSNVYNEGFFEIKSDTFNFEQYNLEQYIEGQGKFYNDSINLSFSIASLSPPISYNCSCLGKKIRDVEVGIKTDLINKAIIIYPNPAKDQLKVLWSALSGKTYNNYRIYNIQGQNVLKNNSQSFESIDVSSLKQGSYIIHFLKDDVSVASGRFVKME